MMVKRDLFVVLVQKVLIIGRTYFCMIILIFNSVSFTEYLAHYTWFRLLCAKILSNMESKKMAKKGQKIFVISQQRLYIQKRIIFK